MFQKKLFIFLMIALAGITYADCDHNGVSYPEGTIMGPKVCINGQWIRR